MHFVMDGEMATKEWNAKSEEVEIPKVPDVMKIQI